MRTINEIFNDRTCYKFLDKPVEKSLLNEIYDITKFGPTSGNSCPMRIVFVQSPEEKEKLFKCLMPANIDKVRSAPVTAIFAYDLRFFDLMIKLYPEGSELRNYFASNAEVALDSAFRNSTLQSAYFMMIARSKGLDCGPMSGFNTDTMNKTFFADSNYRTNFICNLGYRSGDNPFPRLPRLDFEESCKII